MDQVLEFQFYPDKASQAKIDTILEGLRHFWNYALDQMIRLEEGFYWDKDSKQFVEKCQMPWQYRYENEQLVPYSVLLHNYRAAKEAPSVRSFTKWERYQAYQGNKIYTVPELSNMWGWKGGYGYACPVSFNKPCLIRSYTLKNSKIGLFLLNKGETIQNSDLPDWI